MIFHKDHIKNSSPNTAFLLANNWDDYSFKTLFYLLVVDEKGIEHKIGNVKIGYSGQEGYSWVKNKIPEKFKKLDNSFFSLGQEPEYYQNIKNLSPKLSEYILTSLNDIAYNDDLLKSVEEELVFKNSLLRFVSLSAVHNQYKRIILGETPLTEFNFLYHKQKSKNNAEVKLHFHVTPNSKPSTNIHILIGRNGVGKTTLLNNMVSSIMKKENVGEFYDKADSYYSPSPIKEDFFTSIVSISFSAFDPFIPPPNQPKRSEGICYFYIGLKEQNNKETVQLKSLSELCNDFIGSLGVCLSLENKKARWLNAITKLESDMNFAEMGLAELADIKENHHQLAKSIFKRMSSGHAVVLLSITKLIETVEEKTLVLIDEPESHLHPPLLSAFTRALSDLLINRNAVAIVATHSPVVLQEVPKSCVWKLRRSGTVMNAERPEIETFGENVGILTREIFGLEVSKSGFCELLKNSVAEGKSYEEIFNSYDGQLGREGQAILRVLIANRDTQKG